MQIYILQPQNGTGSINVNFVGFVDVKIRNGDAQIREQRSGKYLCFRIAVQQVDFSIAVYARQQTHISALDTRIIQTNAIRRSYGTIRLSAGCSATYRNRQEA